MTEPDLPPYDFINYAAILFPSDKLTVSMLRKLNSSLFDVEGHGIREFFAANASEDYSFGVNPFTEHTNHGGVGLLSSMLKAERDLARHAYEEAHGKPWDGAYEFAQNWEPLPKTRDELAKAIRQTYVYFGIASGLQHADQLVRDFEAQAAAQVKTPKGRFSQRGC